MGRIIYIVHTQFYEASTKKYPVHKKNYASLHKNRISATFYTKKNERKKSGTSSTWNMTTNLMLNRPEPKSGKTLRQLLMAIPSAEFSGTPFLHTINKQCWSDNIVAFGFLPENESDACTLVAGLGSFLLDTSNK